MFQTIIGMELQIRQTNFGPYSKSRVFLREKMHYEDAKDILGATCAVQEDKTKVWYVKKPAFKQSGDTSLVSPELHCLEEDESDLNEYMLDPIGLVVCLPDQDDPEYWMLKRSAHECKYGGPGSTMNFWELSSFTDRLALGVKMHSTAAFLSMPNKDGIIMGGRSSRGFNDKTVRGHSLWLPLTTSQVSDTVMLDENILRPKGGRHVPDDSHEILDPEESREAVRKACALRYLDGYPDTKVIDPIRDNFPACTMPLSSTSPTYITPAILGNSTICKGIP